MRKLTLLVFAFSLVVIPIQGQVVAHPSLWPVEDMAKANTSNTDAQLMAVADAVFRTSMLYGLPITTPVRELWESRFVGAEKKFMAGSFAGTDVGTLVSLYNDVAQALSSPTQTSTSEMTFLRWQLATQEPTFIKSSGKLSPLQAFHLLSILIYQKLNNEAYRDKGNPSATSFQQQLALQNSIRKGFLQITNADEAKLLATATSIFGVN